MHRRGLRRATVSKRAAAVRSWLVFLDGEGIKVGDARRGEVERWLDRRDVGVRARYCLISHLHMFYVWAQRAELVEFDPTVHVERPRLDRRLPRPARRADIARVIDTAPATMAAMLALMADAGLRCCEVARLGWDDVDLDAGVIYVAGKGGRDRVVGIPARLARCLSALSEVSGPVTGRRMSACRVSQIVNAHLQLEGVPATAHQLRHLYATRLYGQTRDLLTVQQALGHASVTSTQIYAAIDPGSAVAAARRLDDDG